LNAPPKKREERVKEKGKKIKKKTHQKRRKPFFLAGKKENTGCVSTRAFCVCVTPSERPFLAVSFGGGAMAALRVSSNLKGVYFHQQKRPLITILML
jgi:hypothetical protein